MRRSLVSALLLALAVALPLQAPAHAGICEAGLACTGTGGCTSAVNACPTADACAGTVDVCPFTPSDHCAGNVDVCGLGHPVIACGPNLQPVCDLLTS